MIWPTFCIDNFFQNPNSVIDFAKTLKFIKSNGNFPGERTDALHKINNDFFDQTTRKIVACLYPNEVYNNIRWRAAQYFQKINPKEHPDKGFVHQDLDTEFTSIVYLSDNNSNTCIYRRIKTPIPSHTVNKEKRYTGKINKNDIKFKKDIEINQSCFEKTIEFKSIKNRMIIFDGAADHGVENFGNKEDEERLTLITFFESISKVDNSSLKFHANECQRY